MARCKWCKKDIHTLKVEFFDESNRKVIGYCGFLEEDGKIELDVDTTWTGFYKLDALDREKTISCPSCGGFPFKRKMFVTSSVRVIMEEE